MGKTIRDASYDGMDKVSKALQSHSETYTEIYNQLMQLAETMGTAWEGSDNLAFVEQIKGFTDDLQNMAKKLSAASQALDKQRANYVARQEDNVTQVKKLVN